MAQKESTTQQSLFQKKEEKKYGYNLSKSQQKALDDMIQKQEDLRMDYIDFVAKTTDWKKNNTEQATQIRLQNKKFYMVMLGLCAVPFRDGVNARSVATALGMYGAMCVFNKGFRKEFGPDHAVNKIMYPYLQHQAEKYPNSKFVKRFDNLRMKMAIEDNDGRLPLTPETAAMTKIGFIEKAYNDMRERPEDANQIIDGYNKAVDLLNELCERDGVEYDEVNRQMSSIISVRSDSYPNYQKYFAECANGQATILQSTLTYVDEDGNEVHYNQSTPKVKDGKLIYAEDDNGNPYMGGFSPRMPASEDIYARKAYQYCDDYAFHFEGTPLQYGSRLSDAAFEMQQTMDATMLMDDYKFVYPDCSKEDAYSNLCNMTSEFAVASHAKLATQSYDKAVERNDEVLKEDAKTAIIEIYGGLSSLVNSENCPQSIVNAHNDFVEQAKEAGVSPDTFSNIGVKVENAGTRNERRVYEVSDATFQLAYEYCKQMADYVPQQWFEGTNKSTYFETDIQFEDKEWTRDRYGNMSHTDGSSAYGEPESKPKNDRHMPNGGPHPDEFDPYYYDDMGPEPGGAF